MLGRPAAQELSASLFDSRGQGWLQPFGRLGEVVISVLRGSHAVVVVQLVVRVLKLFQFPSGST